MIASSIPSSRVWARTGSARRNGDVVTGAAAGFQFCDLGFDQVLEQRGDVRECVIDCHAALLAHPSTLITSHELAYWTRRRGCSS
jgi:hypothetical protein